MDLVGRKCDGEMGRASGNNRKEEEAEMSSDDSSDGLPAVAVESEESFLNLFLMLSSSAAMEAEQEKSKCVDEGTLVKNNQGTEVILTSDDSDDGLGPHNISSFVQPSIKGKGKRVKNSKKGAADLIITDHLAENKEAFGTVVCDLTMEPSSKQPIMISQFQPLDKLALRKGFLLKDVTSSNVVQQGAVDEKKVSPIDCFMGGAAIKLVTVQNPNECSSSGRDIAKVLEELRDKSKAPSSSKSSSPLLRKMVGGVPAVFTGPKLDVKASPFVRKHRNNNGSDSALKSTHKRDEQKKMSRRESKRILRSDKGKGPALMDVEKEFWCSIPLSLVNVKGSRKIEKEVMEPMKDNRDDVAEEEKTSVTKPVTIVRRKKVKGRKAANQRKVLRRSSRKRYPVLKFQGGNRLEEESELSLEEDSDSTLQSGQDDVSQIGEEVEEAYPPVSIGRNRQYRWDGKDGFMQELEERLGNQESDSEDDVVPRVASPKWNLPSLSSSPGRISAFSPCSGISEVENEGIMEGEMYSHCQDGEMPVLFPQLFLNEDNSEVPAFDYYHVEQYKMGYYRSSLSNIMEQGKKNRVLSLLPYSSANFPSQPPSLFSSSSSPSSVHSENKNGDFEQPVWDGRGQLTMYREETALCLQISSPSSYSPMAAISPTYTEENYKNFENVDDDRKVEHLDHDGGTNEGAVMEHEESIPRTNTPSPSSPLEHPDLDAEAVDKAMDEDKVAPIIAIPSPLPKSPESQPPDIVVEDTSGSGQPDVCGGTGGEEIDQVETIPLVSIPAPSSPLEQPKLDVGAGERALDQEETAPELVNPSPLPIAPESEPPSSSPPSPKCTIVVEVICESGLPDVSGGTGEGEMGYVETIPSVSNPAALAPLEQPKLDVGAGEKAMDQEETAPIIEIPSPLPKSSELEPSFSPSLSPKSAIVVEENSGSGQQDVSGGTGEGEMDYVKTIPPVSMPVPSSLLEQPKLDVGAGERALDQEEHAPSYDIPSPLPITPESEPPSSSSPSPKSHIVVEETCESGDMGEEAMDREETATHVNIPSPSSLSEQPKLDAGAGEKALGREVSAPNFEIPSPLSNAPASEPPVPCSSSLKNHPAASSPEPESDVGPSDEDDDDDDWEQSISKKKQKMTKERKKKTSKSPALSTSSSKTCHPKSKVEKFVYDTDYWVEHARTPTDEELLEPIELEFATMIDLNRYRHDDKKYKITDGQSKWQCPACPKSYTTAKECKKHILKGNAHTLYGRCMRKGCTGFFHTPETLIDHMTWHWEKDLACGVIYDEEKKIFRARGDGDPDDNGLMKKLAARVAAYDKANNIRKEEEAKEAAKKKVELEKKKLRLGKRKDFLQMLEEEAGPSKRKKAKKSKDADEGDD